MNEIKKFLNEITSISNCSLDYSDKHEKCAVTNHIQHPCLPVIQGIFGTSAASISPMDERWKDLETVSKLLYETPGRQIEDDTLTIGGVCTTDTIPLTYLLTDEGSSKIQLFRTYNIDGKDGKVFFVVSYKNRSEYRIIQDQKELYYEAFIQQDIYKFLTNPNNNVPSVYQNIVPELYYARTFKTPQTNEYTITLISEDMSTDKLSVNLYDYFTNINFESFIECNGKLNDVLQQYNPEYLRDLKRNTVKFGQFNHPYIDNPYQQALTELGIYDPDHFLGIGDNINFRLRYWYIKNLQDILGPHFFTGLHQIHRSGYCHHDLKADNIYYNPVTQHIRFIDFGAADTFMNTVNCVIDYYNNKKNIEIIPSMYHEIVNKADIWQNALKTDSYSFEALKLIFYIECASSINVYKNHMGLSDERINEFQFFHPYFTRHIFRVFAMPFFWNKQAIRLYDEYVMPYKDMFAEIYADEVLGYYYIKQMEYDAL